MKEASNTIATGTTIAGMRVLVVECGDWWVLAAELVAAAAPLVEVLDDVCVLNAPADDREERSAALEITVGIDWTSVYVCPDETTVDETLMVYVVKADAAIMVAGPELVLWGTKEIRPAVLTSWLSDTTPFTSRGA